MLASAAVVLVLALRPLLLLRLGSRASYGLWLLVPLITLAGMLPARERLVVQQTPSPLIERNVLESGVTEPAAATATSSMDAVHAFALPALDNMLVFAWLSIAMALLARSIWNTRRAARDPNTGPALIGVLRPQLILPDDFATRFNAQERALILAHENVHRVSGHTLVNALVELTRCACWFNPLAHVAAQRIRIDQELACDAAVIAAHPNERRVYAQALLKTQAVSAFLPLGCTWTSRSAERLHERISLLAQPSLSRRAALGGAALIALLGMLAGYAAWAQQPERIVIAIGQAPARVWTPSANAPPNTLSHELEGKRHDLFIELAQKGDIDFVLFGTTDAEMFSWPDRGKPVWDRAFADVKAANFGAQGTSPRSLLWRMQNGELDGYRAKLIVVETGFCMGEAANAGNAGADPRAVFENCTPIFMEIAKRQPQAKVLVVPPFPRGFQDHALWIPIASQNQLALNQLRDGDRVFYADFGERFFLPDGSHNNAMWARAGINGAGVGAQPASFEAVAEELQPWIDRFVR
jgi:beta-lactamase regulating signal transducer with metallopeptidase domain